jgi:hypothetical protein
MERPPLLIASQNKLNETNCRVRMPAIAAESGATGFGVLESAGKNEIIHGLRYSQNNTGGGSSVSSSCTATPAILSAVVGAAGS